MLRLSSFHYLIQAKKSSKTRRVFVDTKPMVNNILNFRCQVQACQTSAFLISQKKYMHLFWSYRLDRDVENPLILVPKSVSNWRIYRDFSSIQKKKFSRSSRLNFYPSALFSFPLSCLQVDVLDMQDRPDNGYLFIMHYQDYNTKLVTLKPLRTNHALEVATHLVG